MPEGAAVRAIPGVGTHVPVWIGSEPLRAQLAAHLALRLCLAFRASHARRGTVDLQNSSKPSQFLSEPHAMVAVRACAAEIDEEA
jgi:alkanesulfonate monooxygenase SsuD/methylene tetrahydromethanopterin reductase-like flavin-dependent oxidoreductase (luciferase family)